MRTLRPSELDSAINGQRCTGRSESRKNQKLMANQTTPREVSKSNFGNFLNEVLNTRECKLELNVRNV